MGKQTSDSTGTTDKHTGRERGGESESEKMVESKFRKEVIQQRAESKEVGLERKKENNSTRE